MYNLFIKAIEGAENKLEGLKTWAKKKKNEPKVMKDWQTMGYMKRLDLPFQEDCVFEVEGITFVGCYIGNLFNQTQVVTSEGLLNLDRDANIKVVRRASKQESMTLVSTKNKVKNHHILRFFKLSDIRA